MLWIWILIPRRTFWRLTCARRFSKIVITPRFVLITWNLLFFWDSFPWGVTKTKTSHFPLFMFGANHEYYPFLCHEHIRQYIYLLLNRFFSQVWVSHLELCEVLDRLALQGYRVVSNGGNIIILFKEARQGKMWTALGANATWNTK